MSGVWDGGPRSPEQPAGIDRSSMVTALDKRKFRVDG